MDVVFVRGNRPRRYSVSLSLRIMSNFADLLASFKASAGAIAGSNSGNLNKNSSIDNSNTRFWQYWNGCNGYRHRWKRV
jgi:hypothetical protein